jgi:hypothetical protein
MEARIARLESEVAQLRANLADVQADVRRQRLDRAIASPRHDIPLISCARVPRRKATWLRLTPVDVPWVLSHVVVGATLLVLMWMGFGWI